MLLVGGDWAGDGADVALGAMVELQRRGLAAGLTVVGGTPPAMLDVEGLTVLPGFDRRQAGHRRQLSRLYGEATLLVLPSRAPTAAALLREAMAHGLPFVASDLPTHRELARLAAGCSVLPARARPAAWADAVASACLDPVAHAQSCRAVHAAYRLELDWTRWADGLVAALATAVTPVGPTAPPRS
jgi:glycosyltransferase involved in cell wall biosynthesis